jgi:hypothetical protein
MNASLLRRAGAIIAVFSAGAASCAESAPSATLAPSVTAPITVYRQILPDGRVLYSDKAIQGAKVDHTIMIDPPIKGNLWTTEAGPRPEIPPQTVPIPVDKVPSIPAPGKKKTIDDANSDVIKAEMLLEDAKKRQEAGAAPLPEERTAAPGNSTYEARQKLLAKEVADAERMLNKAIAARSAMRSARYGQLPQ